MKSSLEKKCIWSHHPLQHPLSILNICDNREFNCLSRLGISSLDTSDRAKNWMPVNWQAGCLTAWLPSFGHSVKSDSSLSCRSFTCHMYTGATIFVPMPPVYSLLSFILFSFLPVSRYRPMSVPFLLTSPAKWDHLPFSCWPAPSLF